MSDRRVKNWELHDGAEDGYEDAVLDSSSGSDIPLVKITHRNRATPIPIGHRKRHAISKMTTGVNLLRENTIRKNADPYFNPVKEAIVYSSDHTVTLVNGHILRKSD